jgi:hypothetical protein
MLFRLAFTDSKHLGATNRACALSRRLTILHGNALGVLHFTLGSTFHTIGLHGFSPFVAVSYEIRLFLRQSQETKKFSLSVNIKGLGDSPRPYH